MWTLDGEEAIDEEPSLARGLATVIAQEYPNFRFRRVDLPVDDAEVYAAGPLGELLIRELIRDGSEPHVALRGRHRWEPFYARLRSSPVGPGRRRRGGVCLITGGLGGIGLKIAEYLAREFQAKLVLVGRSAPADDTSWSEVLRDDTAPEALRATLKRLLLIRELGGEVRMFCADVTDRAAMEEVRRSALRALGPIDGIVHAAGCVPESIVQRMTWDSARRAMRAKVEGTRIRRKSVHTSWKSLPLCWTQRCASALPIHAIARRRHDRKPLGSFRIYPPSICSRRYAANV